MAYADCIRKLADAAGRSLSDAEISAIFERVHKAALDIKAGRTEPGDVTLGKKLGDQLGVGMSQDQFIQMTAERAAAELLHEAELKERQAQLQVIAVAGRADDMAMLNSQLPAKWDKAFRAVDGLIARDYSGRTNIESVEQRVSGVKGDLKRQIGDVWNSLGNDWLGFFQDKAKLLLLVRELRGENTGDAIAHKGAEAFHNAAEYARQTWNAHGGDTGKLDDWGMPQHHSQEKVSAAGKEAWIDDTMPMLDRSRYEDFGVPWDDARMRDFLGKAWDTIATNGIANLTPGEFTGTGKRANKHAESRQIHFKDAESVLGYWEKYGDKTVLEILDGHIEKMAKDIAFVEKFGPNPDLTYRTLRDRALQEAAMADPTKTTELQGRAMKSDNLYDYAAGKIKPTANQTMTNIADGIAHLNSAGKLGGAMIASLFGDKVSYESVGHLNNIPAYQRWINEIALLNPTNTEGRADLLRHGLMAEYVRNGLNRFYEGISTGGGGWSGEFNSVTGKMANAVMRITGMNAINEIRKGAFGIGLMNAIGNEVASGKDFAALHDSDVRVLKTFGVTEADWNIWKLAQPEDLGYGNTKGITPEAIARIPDADLQAIGVDPQVARRDAIVKLLGIVNTESDFAITTPGWRERAAFYGRLQRGTFTGEVARSVMQFKAFPWAFFERSMDAVANADGPVGKTVMASYLIAATTLAGAMIMQTRDVLSGKDPRRMMDDNWYKFWGQAFLQGGALGIYGDFIQNAIRGVTQGNSGQAVGEVLKGMSGPTVGPLLELGIINPINDATKYMQGKQTHFLAHELQDIKGFVPGNNIWYTKALTDHLIMQRMMDAVSPGYLSSIRQKTMKDNRQDWWWAPGESSPDRAPAFSEATR